MDDLLRQALGWHANVDSPRLRQRSDHHRWLAQAGARLVWDRQQVRQYLDGLRTNSTATAATGSWTIYRWGWQFTGSEGLDKAYVPFFGAFGTAWDDAMVARWSASALAGDGCCVRCVGRRLWRPASRGAAARGHNRDRLIYDT